MFPMWDLPVINANYGEPTPQWLGSFLEATRQMIRRELVASQKREMALFQLLREHEHWMASLDPGTIPLHDWEFIHQHLHQQLHDLLDGRDEYGDTEGKERDL